MRQLVRAVRCRDMTAAVRWSPARVAHVCAATRMQWNAKWRTIWEHRGALCIRSRCRMVQ
eukprot:4237520-Prymnesium_polylepis.1